MKGVGVCGEKKAATNLKMLNVKKSRVHKKASASTPPTTTLILICHHWMLLLHRILSLKIDH